MKTVYDRVGAVLPADISFATTIQPLLDLDQDSETRGAVLVIPAMVALDKAVRDASTEAEKRLDDLHVEMKMRKDVFDNIHEVIRNNLGDKIGSLLWKTIPEYWIINLCFIEYLVLFYLNCFLFFCKRPIPSE